MSDSRFFENGYDAYYAQVDIDKNYYTEDTYEYYEFRAGWYRAKSDDESYQPYIKAES